MKKAAELSMTGAFCSSGHKGHFEQMLANQTSTIKQSAEKTAKLRESEEAHRNINWFFLLSKCQFQSFPFLYIARLVLQEGLILGCGSEFADLRFGVSPSTLEATKTLVG